MALVLLAWITSPLGLLLRMTPTIWLLLLGIISYKLLLGIVPPILLLRIAILLLLLRIVCIEFSHAVLLQFNQ